MSSKTIYPCACPGCNACDDIDHETGAKRESAKCQRRAIVHVTDDGDESEYRSCGSCADDAITSGEGWYVRITA